MRRLPQLEVAANVSLNQGDALRGGAPAVHDPRQWAADGRMKPYWFPVVAAARASMTRWPLSALGTA